MKLAGGRDKCEHFFGLASGLTWKLCKDVGRRIDNMQRGGLWLFLLRWIIEKSLWGRFSKCVFTPRRRQGTDEWGVEVDKTKKNKYRNREPGTIRFAPLGVVPLISPRSRSGFPKSSQQIEQFSLARWYKRERRKKQEEEEEANSLSLESLGSSGNHKDPILHELANRFPT